MKPPLPEPKLLDRRSFLKRGLSGGLTLGIALHGNGMLARAANAAAIADPGLLDWSPDVFLNLSPSGDLTIIAHRSEMGTGIATVLPMVLADEMEADWERVTIVQGDADRAYGSQNTDGSRSIRNFYDRMRQAGAMARTMLMSAAAESWGVPAAECRAESHVVYHDASERSLGYGALAAGAADLAVPEPGSLTLKPASARRYIGKDMPIRDLEGILDGSAGFGMDVRLPDMKVAVIARSPVLGGTATKWDEAAALAVAGVERIVELPFIDPPFEFNALGGIAVIARDTWSAIKGRESLQVQWDDGAHGDFDSIRHAKDLLASVAKPGTVVREFGESKGDSSTAQTITADYSLPHLAHASMETPCATARLTDDGAELWMTTQAPQGAQQRIAQALGLSPEMVTIHVTLLGGGFGRKSKPDFGVEAALLAREVGAPVQVVWTREDDLQHDYFHAASAMHFEATLDAQGNPTAWLQRTAFTPIGYTFNPAAKHGGGGELSLGFTDIPYDLPQLKVESCPAETHVRVGWLRSVCNVFHACGVGCFTDELAAAAGRDPMEYLLERIGPARHVDLESLGLPNYDNYGSPIDKYPLDTGRLRAVLEKAGEMAQWKTRAPLNPDKDGIRRGLGVAAHRSFLGYVANVVEVEVDAAGNLTIPRVHVAVDCGLAIHPDRVHAQMEGAVVFGTSLTRFGAITGKDGRIEQSNFHDYPVARTMDAPAEIEVHIMPSEEPPTGVGEIGVPPFAPALLNAVFAATGRRIRDLPLSGHDLKKA